MSNYDNLQEKWQPVLEHEDLDNISDPKKGPSV